MIIDMKRRGFTIVELLIVITIMGALLILSIANLRGSQISARDSERKTDIETIALHLDNYYVYGSDYTSSTGKYPSTQTADPASGNAYITKALRDIDVNSIIAPGSKSPTFVAATNNSTVTTSVTPQPAVLTADTNQYIYQPLQSDGTLCTLESQECRKFNLYYRLEADNTVYKVSGKYQ